MTCCGGRLAAVATQEGSPLPLPLPPAAPSSPPSRGSQGPRLPIVVHKGASLKRALAGALRRPGRRRARGPSPATRSANSANSARRVKELKKPHPGACRPVFPGGHPGALNKGPCPATAQAPRPLPAWGMPTKCPGRAPGRPARGWRGRVIMSPGSPCRSRRGGSQGHPGTGMRARAPVAGPAPLAGALGPRARPRPARPRPFFSFLRRQLATARPRPGRRRAVAALFRDRTFSAISAPSAGPGAAPPPAGVVAPCRALSGLGKPWKPWPALGAALGG